MKSYVDFTDDVNGTIVGDVRGQCWVQYEGRQQGSTKYPLNELEAMEMCEEEVRRIKEDCGQAFSLIYPNKSGWSFRFDGI